MKHRGKVSIPVGSELVKGALQVLPWSEGIIILTPAVSDSASLRRTVTLLHEAGLSTLYLDGMCPPDKESKTEMILSMARWISEEGLVHKKHIGLYGEGAGGVAGLMAASERSDLIAAAVAVDAPLDLAGDSLLLVHSPTLLIVRGDLQYLESNRIALGSLLTLEKRLEVLPGTSRAASSEHAALWFRFHLNSSNNHWPIAESRAMYLH